MKKSRLFLIVPLLAVILIAILATGQSVPQLINYQGKLTDSAGQPLDGVTVTMTFKFYGHESEATPLFLTVVQNNVQVSGGIYHVLIGSGTITPGDESSLAGVFQNHSEVWMGVTVNGDSEMTPRARISSVGYAIKADRASSVDTGSIMAASIGEDCEVGEVLVRTSTGWKCGWPGGLFATPSDLTADAVSISQIDLSWTDNSSNGIGFKIERKTGEEGTYAQIDTVGADVTSYQDTGLDHSTTYYYRVRAYNATGDSDYSNEANATTHIPPALIPAGCFMMGDHFDEGHSGELPVHEVCITSDFYMDVTPVTNAQYKACVNAGVCTAPGQSNSHTRASYYGNPTYDDYPVIYVSWHQATDYCSWAGKRLPTEAEWEYAARGGLSGKRYPHGDDISCADACYGRYDSSSPCWNYGGLDNDTHPVASYAPNGYGLYDMAGNVGEWVNDWYSETYYQYCVDNNIVNDPPGPDAGSYRVVRGGSWYCDPYYLRVAVRLYTFYRLFNLGFRCAGD